MTNEPVAYRVDGTIYNNINDAEFAVRETKHLRKALGIDNGLIPKPVYIEQLYTAEQLHPRVKMTQAEFDEFIILRRAHDYSLKRFLIIVSNGDIGCPLLKKRYFIGVEEQLALANLWANYRPEKMEEMIEIVPEKKWFVRVDSQVPLPDENIYLDDELIVYPHYNSPKSGAHQFDTKEQAEEWTNPLTEAVLLPVED